MAIDISHIQYLHDGNGNTTAVQIPIKDWEYIESQLTKSDEIPNWHKPLLDERIKRAKEEPSSMRNFDEVMREIENEI